MKNIQPMLISATVHMILGLFRFTGFSWLVGVADGRAFVSLGGGWSHPPMPKPPVVVEVSGDRQIAVHIEQHVKLASGGFADLGGDGDPAGVDLDEASVDGAVSVECPDDLASAVESGVDGVGSASGFAPCDVGEDLDW
jgi:hypothetical protein